MQTIVAETLCTEKVNGFMLIGSVARGDAYPDSDLDFYILLEEGQKKKFHSETREGILVEYKCADVNQILVTLKQSDGTIFILEGEILFDKSGDLKN